MTSTPTMTEQANADNTTPASAANAKGRYIGYWGWIGAHGGAGVTTLAQAVPGGIDLGRNLPLQDRFTALPAVIVCRGNARGLLDARSTAATASLSTRVLGLVVVADMPERRRPKPLADSLYVTKGAFEAVWEIPWVTPWRLGEDPHPDNNPPEVRDLLRGLWTAVNLPLPGGTQHRRTK